MLGCSRLLRMGPSISSAPSPRALTAMYRVEQKKIKSLGAIPLITKLLSSRTPEVQVPLETTCVAVRARVSSFRRRSSFCSMYNPWGASRPYTTWSPTLKVEARPAGLGVTAGVRYWSLWRLIGASIGCLASPGSGVHRLAHRRR